MCLPGFEGNVSVKGRRRLNVTAEPAYSREKTSKYTDLMPDGTARQFTFVMDAKSIVTRPSGTQRITPASTRSRALPGAGAGGSAACRS